MRRVHIRSIVAGLLALLVLATASFAERVIRMDSKGDPIPSTAASFDCSKAAGFAETTICSDVPLAMADRGIDETYQFLLQHSTPEAREAIRREQRDWLRRRNTCTERQCLEQALDARDRQLTSVSAALDKTRRANVRQVGQCETTRIDFIGPRLEQVEGEEPQGTTVDFANGVSQVSYDREPAVLKSRKGDPVHVCLVSIPRNCPRGDDRGKIYSAINLRTHAQWKLPDSSHRCGGA